MILNESEHRRAAAKSNWHCLNCKKCSQTPEQLFDFAKTKENVLSNLLKQANKQFTDAKIRMETFHKVMQNNSGIVKELESILNSY